MRLTTQLLIVAAVTLILPALTYQALVQIDSAYRQLRMQELLAEARTIRHLLRDSATLQSLSTGLARQPQDIYAEPLRYIVSVDGYNDDWIHARLPETTLTYADFKSTAVHNGGSQIADLRFKAGKKDHRLYLYFDVRDDKVVYHAPEATTIPFEYALEAPAPSTAEIASGDHLILYLEDSTGAIRKTWFRVAAPGPTHGVYYGESDGGVRPVFRETSQRAHWIADSDGYDLEISLPLPKSGSRFGFSLVDRDQSYLRSMDAWVGTVDPVADEVTGRLYTTQEQWQPDINELVSAGNRVRLFDETGQLRLDVNHLYQQLDNPVVVDPARSTLINALLFRFFSWAVALDQPRSDNGFVFANPFTLNIESLTDTADRTEPDIRHYQTAGNDQVSGQLHTIEVQSHRFYLLHESNDNLINSFTSSAFVRMFTALALAGLLITGSLLVYASWLSLRIRRLSRQVRSAVTGDGRIQTAISASRAGDELGVLSRDFKSLIDRSAGYTGYLESLASRLSHELRTPLVVAQSSLENLANLDLQPEQAQLIDRARAGLHQLESTIGLMSEASRLEHIADQAEPVEFDALGWLNNAVMAYQAIHDTDIQLQSNLSRPTAVGGIPELLQQALDKLVDNAVDYSKGKAPVVVKFQQTGTDRWAVSVLNHGSIPDEGVIKQMFEPLYSGRAVQNTTAHLGLGLYIVRIVARAHGGREFARVSDDGWFEVGFSLVDRHPGQTM